MIAINFLKTDINFIAFYWFLFCFFSYSIYHFKNPRGSSLNQFMFEHRVNWMKHSIVREDRAVDAVTIGHLMRSVTFFASTSILIVAALMPLLGYGEKLNKMLHKLPFATENYSPLIEFKIMLLVVIFIYAFFKYTWSLRQYSYAEIMILAAPIANQPLSEELSHIAIRNAKILSNSSRHFNLGMRSYYFGIAVLSWLVNPYLFIVFSTLIALVIFRREFFSHALDIIVGK